ncbi:MAG: cation:proton antiporter [Allorhizobium sp.]
MIDPSMIILAACNFALFVLGISFFLTVFRVVRGPTLPDRVLALDMLVGIAIGFIAVIAIKTGYSLYIDIAISLGLVGFLATVAFARFILARGSVCELPTPGSTTAKSPVERAKDAEKGKSKGERKDQAKAKRDQGPARKSGPPANKGKR